MRKSRFSEDQVVKILREADKAPVAEVSKKHGVAEQTVYLWRQRFGCASPARNGGRCAPPTRWSGSTRNSGDGRRRKRVPSQDAVLLFGLLRSGQIGLRAFDGWQEMRTVKEAA